MPYTTEAVVESRPAFTFAAIDAVSATTDEELVPDTVGRLPKVVKVLISPEVVPSEFVATTR